MKKVLSIILATAVLLSCMTITVFAQEQNSKITSTLAQKLEDLSEGEKLETCIWLFYQHDADLVERKTYEECGLTAGTCMTLEEVDLYSKTYNRISGELEAAGNKALIEKAGVAEKDIIFCGTVSPLVILDLTEEQVCALSEFKEVQILDYDTALSAEASEMLHSQTGTSASVKSTVHIWLHCPIDKSAVFQQAIKECGYIGGLPLDMTIEEVNAYRAVYNRIISEQEAAVADAFVKKLGIAEEDIVYLGKHPYVIASLTEEQIEAAATYPEVESINYEPEKGTPTVEPNRSDPAVPPYLYKARFGQEYAGQYKENEWYYKELYYHKDENGETDWALVYAMLPTRSPIELVTIVGNRVLSPGTQYEPFDAGYGIYDVKEDKFIDAGSLSAKNCPDFVRVFDEIVTEGRMIGDLDQDNAITIFDVTLLQRCDAGLRDYPEDDVFYVTYEWGSPRYYSDFDRDGDRTIIDATLIQRYLVGIA